MDKVHPREFTNFLKYRGTKFEKYVLPIIPVGVTLTELSKIPPKNLGKIPGRWKGAYGGADEWTGFDGWQTYYQSANGVSLERYQMWQEKTGLEIAMGFNSPVLLGFDADTDSPEIAQWMRVTIEGIIGPTFMVRRRDGAIRFVMCYRRDEHTLPFSKMRFVGVDKDDNKHLLEILGSSHQWVAEGPHAKGAMHYWENELPVHEMWDQIPVIDHVKASTIKRTLDKTCSMVGLEVRSSLSVVTSSDRASAVSITNVTSPHIEDNRERLTKAIQHIDLDHKSPVMDYDAFITLLRAICASVMGDLNYFTEVVWPWACTQKEARGQGPRTEEQGIEWFETRWKSFTDSNVGPDHVYWWAHQCGYDEALKESKDERAQELFGAITDQGDDAGADGAGGAGHSGAAGGAAGAAGGNGSGSNGPLNLRDAAIPVAEDLIPVLAPEWRYAERAHEWYRFVKTRWVVTPAPWDLILDRTRQLAQTLRAVVPPFLNAEARAQRCENVQHNAAIQRALEKATAMQVAEGQFDDHPHLLNTPEGVLNLKTGALDPHPQPRYLMRHMTAVSPDLRLAMSYPRGQIPWSVVMPGFWSLLSNISHDPHTGEHRPHVIRALQLWFGQALIGQIRHQAMLFTEGLPGIGKTQVFEVLAQMLGSYTKRVLISTLSKNGDGHRFDLVDFAGKRLYFLDETQLGMVWDETRGCLLVTAPEISTDTKNGKTVVFPNRGTLIVAGNHRPHFISHEAGGLSSRLMLLSAGGKVYRDTAADKGNTFAAELVAAEGRTIMMWALEGAMSDYVDQNGGWRDWRATMEPLRAATKEYTRENSPVILWLQDRQMVLDDDASMDTMQAFQMFRAYGSETGNKTVGRMALSDFKTALRAAFPSIEIGRRTSGEPKGRSILLGLGVPEIAFGDTSNVVALTGVNKQ